MPADPEQPLRHAVLAGRFFGPARAAAERLAAWLAAPSLAEWFSPAALASFAAAPDSLREALDRDVALIDAAISAQLDAILHHPRLQRLEGSWRGLRWLAEAVPPGARIKLKLLGLAWSELCRDLERAVEFDQSQLFRKLYEDEFGSPGGEPFGLLVIDHELRHRPGPGTPTDDVSALTALTGVAAAAFIPTILAASPALLGVDEFADLANVTDLAAPFRAADYARWRGLAQREDCRFLAITLPRVLARAPWCDDTARADGFRYAEDAPDAASRVGVSAGYAFAPVALRAVGAYAWPADVRGSETDRIGGGVVLDLPGEPFASDPGTPWLRPSLDVVFTDRAERSLAELGLMPLAGLAFTEAAAFSALRSLQTPVQFSNLAANANARLSAQINAMLCVSRFAHYLKMLGREMVGAFRTADEIERQLHGWLMRYVNASSASAAENRARYPLVAGAVSVREMAGRPGVFGCTIQLQPHFQLDDVAATFRLVTEIAAPGRR